MAISWLVKSLKINSNLIMTWSSSTLNILSPTIFKFTTSIKVLKLSLNSMALNYPSTTPNDSAYSIASIIRSSSSKSKERKSVLKPHPLILSVFYSTMSLYHTLWVLRDKIQNLCLSPLLSYKRYCIKH